MKLFTIILLGVCLINMTTFSKDAGNNFDFKSKFSEWENEINIKIKKGYSKIYANPSLVKELSQHAHLNEKFLKAKLKTNMFVYQILDGSEILTKKYHIIPFSEGNVQSQQEKWLKVLNDESQ